MDFLSKKAAHCLNTLGSVLEETTLDSATTSALMCRFQVYRFRVVVLGCFV